MSQTLTQSLKHHRDTISRSKVIEGIEQRESSKQIREAMASTATAFLNELEVFILENEYGKSLSEVAQ